MDSVLLAYIIGNFLREIKDELPDYVDGNTSQQYELGSRVLDKIKDYMTTNGYVITDR